LTDKWGLLYRYFSKNVSGYRFQPRICSCLFSRI